MFPPLARLALHRGEHAPLMGIACPTFSSLDERQGIKQWRFIVLRCARPWIITAVSTVVSTPRLAHSPTLTANRSRTGIFLSAKAQAGGEVAVFLPLACR